MSDFNGSSKMTGPTITFDTVHFAPTGVAAVALKLLNHEMRRVKCQARLETLNDGKKIFDIHPDDARKVKTDDTYHSKRCDYY